jgi:hypothetical protein
MIAHIESSVATKAFAVWRALCRRADAQIQLVGTRRADCAAPKVVARAARLVRSGFSSSQQAGAAGAAVTLPGADKPDLSFSGFWVAFLAI